MLSSLNSSPSYEKKKWPEVLHFVTAYLPSIFRFVQFSGRNLDEALQLYMTLSSDLFTQNKVLGYSMMLFKHAYYDTEKFEKLLREYIGDTPMIQTNRQEKCPKVSWTFNILVMPGWLSVPAQAMSGSCG